MPQRIALDDLTSDALDQLYAERDALASDLAELTQADPRKKVGMPVQPTSIMRAYQRRTLFGRKRWWYDCTTCAITCGPFGDQDAAISDIGRHVEQQHQPADELARFLAGAAHLNPQRDTAAWDNLDEADRDRYREQARRIVSQAAPDDARTTPDNAEGGCECGGGTGIRGLLEHVGIDTTGRDITVAGRLVDPAPDPQYVSPEFFERLHATKARDDSDYASCPGYETEPNLCRCPCYGCQHNCAAHRTPAPDPLREQYAAAMWASAEHNIVAEWICCEPLDPKHELCAQGYMAMRMIRSLIVDSPDAWKPAPLTDAVMAVRDRELEQLRAQVARVRDALTERRTQVAEYEAGNEPSAWSDAVTVTCARVEDALRVFPEPGAIRDAALDQPQEQP